MHTMKEWVDKIVAPYRQKKIDELKLQATQKMVLLLDLWSVHRSKEFRKWMKENHPHIILLYVPGGCTGKFQPCDVIVQRPFKASVTSDFQNWVAAQCTDQISSGVLPGEVRLSTSKPLLRDLNCEWMYRSWKLLTEKEAQMKAGWEKCGLLRAWEKEFQTQAKRMNAEGALFPNEAPTSHVPGGEIILEGQSWQSQPCSASDVYTDDAGEGVDAILDHCAGADGAKDFAPDDEGQGEEKKEEIEVAEEEKEEKEEGKEEGKGGATEEDREEKKQQEIQILRSRCGRRACGKWRIVTRVYGAEESVKCVDVNKQCSKDPCDFCSAYICKCLSSN